MSLDVIIAGAGLGGLTLAQALRRQGVGVAVFDRDHGPWDRPQGYRLHLDADGVGAVQAVLPDPLRTLFGATTMRPDPVISVLGPSLQAGRTFPADGPRGNDPDDRTHANVDRATLRQILLTGLDDVITWGTPVAGYASDDTGVTVVFGDGSRRRADLLVGADGIRSAVRRTRAPGITTMDTRIRAIYGRLPIDVAADVLPASVLHEVFTVITDDRHMFCGLGPVVFPTRPDLAAASVYPDALLRPREDYVVCITGGRIENFGATDEQLRGLDSPALRQHAAGLTADWPDASRGLARYGDPESFFAVEMSSSVPAPLPRSGTVTLLGDAIHAMTPTLGRGANVAMRDARVLSERLAQVVAGEYTLAEALLAYEADLTAYGFAVVRHSAQYGSRIMNQEPLPAPASVGR